MRFREMCKGDFEPVIRLARGFSHASSDDPGAAPAATRSCP